MQPETLKAWRLRLHLSKKKAAEQLGIGYSTYKLYEHGRRFGTGTPVTIPRSVELACAALAFGITHYPELDPEGP